MIILSVVFIFFYPYLDFEYNSWIHISDINFWMVILVVFLFLIIIIIETSIKIRIIFIFISLFYGMLFNNIVRFFLVYEIVFILIIFSLIVLGYRFERLIAGFLIIFYSFLFSRPTLIILIIFDYSFLIKLWMSYSSLLLYFFVGSFIVKFPIFGVHYWLPVAHVEASTIGSIILAGLLLKLGGIGIFYIVNYMRFIVKIHWLALAVCVVILITLVIRDLKIVIAYSSVAHITIVFYILSIGSWVGKKGVLLIMFYHGFISPLIFWVVGLLGWWKTRSLLVLKFIVFSSLFIYILFILFIMNIRFPPFIGFLREILMLKSLILNFYVIILIVIGVLFSCYYNMYLFWCFNNRIGWIFKLNFYRLDLFLFLLLILILNLY